MITQQEYAACRAREKLPQHLQHLGIAGLLTALTGAVEGAISVIPSARRQRQFAPSYALLNVLPSFVGQQVSASLIVNAMGLKPSVLVACPNAALQVAACRMLRTGIAGFTVLHMLVNMSLESRDSALDYDEEVREGNIGPNPALYVNDGVQTVRLCDSESLVAAIVGGCALPVLLDNSDVQSPYQVNGKGISEIMGWKRGSTKPFYHRIRSDQVMPTVDMFHTT